MSIRLLIKIKETAYLVEAARLMYSRGRVKVKSRPGHDRAHETLSFPRCRWPYSDIDLMQLPRQLPRLRAVSVIFAFRFFPIFLVPRLSFRFLSFCNRFRCNRFVTSC